MSLSYIGQILPQLIVFIGFFSAFYFLILRPETKRQEDTKKLLNALQIGDVVYTSGGIVGKVTALHDNFCQLSTHTNTQFYIQKNAITMLVPKGSLKALGF